MFVFSDALPLFCRTLFVNEDSHCFLLATINPILAVARGSINAVYKEMIKANAVNTVNYSMW